MQEVAQRNPANPEGPAGLHRAAQAARAAPALHQTPPTNTKRRPDAGSTTSAGSTHWPRGP